MYDTIDNQKAIKNALWACDIFETDSSYLISILQNSPELVHIKSEGRGNTLLHICSLRGYLECIKLITSRGADVNQLNNSGEDALILSIIMRRNLVTDFLLSEKTNVNRVCANFGMSPLLLALNSCNLFASLRIFGCKRVDKNTICNEGFGVADYIIRPESLELIDKITELDKKAVNIRGKYGNTMLHRAMIKDSTELTELLLSKGSNVKSRNNNGLTPLHYVAQTGKAKLAELLLRVCPECTNEMDNEGQTPLVHAIRATNTELVDLLLPLTNELGSDSDGVPIIHHALDTGKEDLIDKVFLRQGGHDREKDTNKVTGETCAHRVVLYQTVDLLKSLVDKYGVNLCTKDYEGDTPLCYASLIKSESFISYLPKSKKSGVAKKKRRVDIESM